jgi:hypothetical protein
MTGCRLEVGRENTVLLADRVARVGLVQQTLELSVQTQQHRIRHGFSRRTLNTLRLGRGVQPCHLDDLSRVHHGSDVVVDAPEQLPWTEMSGFVERLRPDWPCRIWRVEPDLGKSGLES